MGDPDGSQPWEDADGGGCGCSCSPGGAPSIAAGGAAARGGGCQCCGSRAGLAVAMETAGSEAAGSGDGAIAPRKEP